ncbi:MAG TPA: protein translocase subunit SecF [Thermomicrobiales bacterium]|nr:protein translocase subunit SecF [Thermomicrobiales bacterium]
MEHLASKRKLWFTISLIALLPGLISLLFFGLKLGIDFTGGSQLLLQFDEPVATESVAAVLRAQGYESVQVQTVQADQGYGIQIRMPEVREGSPEKERLYQGFRDEVGTFTELDFSTIGASVGNEIRDRAILAVALASIGILLYIGYAFRNTQNPWLYGTCAIVAMLHDVLIVVGVFSILGAVANVEIDALFVTALLTVIGFSVHDTIVVFDRIRENLARLAAPTFEGIVDYSLAQTLVRSLNTSLTVVLTLLALYLFGGTSTRNFVLALLIGVVVGTYSSIFNASQLLVAWENGEIQRLFRRGTRRGPRSGRVAVSGH